MVLVVSAAAAASKSCSSSVLLARRFIALRPTVLPVVVGSARRTFSETPLGQSYRGTAQQREDGRSLGGSKSPASASGDTDTTTDTDTSGGSRSSAPAVPAGYVSPYQDLFDRMHANGPTILGTTDRVVELERKLRENSPKLQCGIPEADLRFSSATWGRVEKAPYVMTKEHQVTVKVHTDQLPLSKQEMEILREIVGGRRLNDDRRELRLSSNAFGSRIENKRHVVSMLDRIVCSCQRLGKTLQAQQPPDSSTGTNNNNAAAAADDEETTTTSKETAPS